jgi:hypothetical protein
MRIQSENVRTSSTQTQTGTATGDSQTIPIDDSDLEVDLRQQLERQPIGRSRTGLDEKVEGRDHARGFRADESRLILRRQFELTVRPHRRRI